MGEQKSKKSGGKKEIDLAALQHKMPPQNADAERALLGAIMLHPDAFHKVSSLITPEDFYLQAHRWIFEVLLKQEVDNKPLDVISISDRLADRDQLYKIGGLAYLSEVLDRVPTSAHVAHYASIVREKAIVRKLISVSTEIIKESYEEVEDVSTFLDSAERRIFEIRQGRSKNDMLPIAEVVMTAFQKVEELYSRKELVTGTTTGFEKFDKMTAGLQPSDLLILAGRPSMGKTSLALNMATNAALRGKCPVVVFSLEMSAEQLVMRMLCSEARVDASRLRTGHMEESDIPRLTKAATELSQADVYIDDNGDATILDLRAKCRRIHAKHGSLGLVVIDYLQLMKGSSKAASREQEISEISRGLKALAKELHTPVLALSQLNRSLERRPDKRPIMSDLRECVTGETRVFLADGRQIPIRELVGETPEVIAMTPEGKLKPALADKVWSVGEREIFNIRLNSGRSIQATAKHRLYGHEGWKRVSELDVGERLAIVKDDPPSRTLISEHAELPKAPKLKQLATNELFWDEIQSIEPAGRAEVFDLTVPEYSSWLANGIVSHNSGAIEQDADVICFVYRDEVYNAETEEKGIAEVIIGKQRNGPIGTVRLRFFHPYTRFDNLYED